MKNKIAKFERDLLKENQDIHVARLSRKIWGTMPTSVKFCDFKDHARFRPITFKLKKFVNVRVLLLPLLTHFR